MKRFFGAIYEIITHICLAMTLGLALLCYLEGRNPLMRFLNSDVSRIYIWVLCGFSFLVCIVQLARFARRK